MRVRLRTSHVQNVAADAITLSHMKLSLHAQIATALAWVHACVRARARVRACVRACARACVRVLVRMHVCGVRACVRLRVCMCACVCIRALNKPFCRRRQHKPRSAVFKTRFFDRARRWRGGASHR
eukprot:6177747-Pleurochrysis_carterae.AAC.2